MSLSTSASGLINFQGLVSGINTSAIIQALVGLTTAQEAPLQAQIATLNNQNSALNTLNKDLLAVLSALTPLLSSSTFQAKSAASSNTGAFSATAGTTATNGIYNINVTQLATPTSVTSNGTINPATQGLTGANIAGIGRFVDPDIQLQYAGFATTPTTGSFTLSHNGVNAVITVNAATDSLNSVINKINTAGIGVTAGLSGDKLTLTASDGNPIGVGSISDTSNFLQATNLSTGVANAGPPYSISSSVHLGAVNPTALLTGASTVLANPAAPTLSAVAGGTLNPADTYQVEVVAYNANGYLTQASPASTVTGNNAINVTFAPVAGATGYLLFVKDNTAGETSYQGIDIGNSTSYTINGHTAGTRVNPVTNETGGSVANFNPGTGPSPVLPTTGNISINGTSISISATDTLTSLIGKINSSAAQVTATFNPGLDTIALSNANPGNTAISLSDTSSNFLSAAGLLGATQSIGKQSGVSVNGTAYYNNSNTVTNAIPGVTLTLAGIGTGTLTVSANTQTATDSFNSVVTALNQFETDLYSNSTPPTLSGSSKAQKASGAGVLFGNFLVINDQVQVEQSFINQDYAATGPYHSLEDLGLSFTSKLGVANTWKLDTTKLQSALTSNPQAVSTLVTQLATSIQNAIQQVTGNTAGIPSIVALNNNNVAGINKQIAQIQSNADAQQKALQAQFAALETFLSQEQSTMSYLSQQLSLLNTAAAGFSTSSSGGGIFSKSSSGH